MPDFNVVFLHQHNDTDLAHVGHDSYSFRVTANSVDGAVGLAEIQFRETHPQLIHSDFLPAPRQI